MIKYLYLFIIVSWGIFTGFTVNMWLLNIEPVGLIKIEDNKVHYNKCIQDGFKYYQCKSWIK